jgi:hypothetical protein
MVATLPIGCVQMGKFSLGIFVLFIVGTGNTGDRLLAEGFARGNEFLHIVVTDAPDQEVI